MTTRSSPWPALTTLLLALLTVAASLGFEYAVFQLRLEGSRTFNMQPQLWARVGGGLALAALLLATSWVAWRIRPATRLVGVVFLLATSWVAWRIRPATRLAGVALLLVGLPIALYPVLIFAPPLRGWLPVPPWLGLGNHFQLAGAFLAVLGLILVVRRS